jgi:pimeloyl-ACP methyl ester carboxylesterase
MREGGAMTTPQVLLVHGVPETSAIWEPLIAALRERGVERVDALSPPGFGAALPDDFAATASDYHDWLVSELVARQEVDDGPVDIVGHDWGAGHVYRLAADRPDLIRSWVADIGGLLHPDYVWHDTATAWRQPEIGEQMIEMMVGLPLGDRVAMFNGLGLPATMSETLADGIDADMGRAILALYRSSPESELRSLADRLAAADHRPGAIITATDDSYVPAAMAGAVAERFGVDEIVLQGQGHWWMVSDPNGAADRLVSFWSTL